MGDDGLRFDFDRNGFNSDESDGRKIVIAVDETDASMFALSWAINNIIKSRGSSPRPLSQSDRIILLHVQPHQHLVHGYYMTPEVQDSVRKHHEEICKTVFSRARVICSQHDVKAETMVVFGDARDAICQTVDKLQPNFLVMGSHGYGPIKRAFLGSVSDYCAHKAKCPVVIVKKQ